MEKTVSGLCYTPVSGHHWFNAPDGRIDPKPTEISGYLEQLATAPPAWPPCVCQVRCCAPGSWRGSWLWHVCIWETHNSQLRSDISLCQERNCLWHLAEITARNAGARSLNFVHKIQETWIAVFVTAHSIADLLLEEKSLETHSLSTKEVSCHEYSIYFG